MVLTGTQASAAREMLHRDEEGRLITQPPIYDPTEVIELKAELERALAPIIDLLPSAKTIFLSKSTLTSVHRCEGLRAAQQEHRKDHPFELQLPMVKGMIAHKAIEASAFDGGSTQPMVLVRDSLDVLSKEDHQVAEFIETLSPVELSTLLSRANNDLMAFLENCFPLAPWLSPRCEFVQKVNLCDGHVVLWTKLDLLVGQGRAVAEGVQAGKVIIDLKTGWERLDEHRADAAFYALTDTLLTRVPTFRTATYYLDSARTHVQEVSMDVLRSGARRVVDAVFKLAHLEDPSYEAPLQPGFWCRFCPVNESCGPGSRFLAAAGADAGDLF